jgi:RNA polymerase sigma-70 factor (ECF subfamily)
MNEREQKRIFDEWLNNHKGIFFKIVRAYAFTPADQEDLFQEISLQVWKSIPDFRGEAKASTWIYRVALYVAVAWVRQEKKQPSTRPLADVEQTLIANTAVQDERLNWLYEQIALLNPIDRSLSLLLLEGFSYKEMADIVGISESNVGVKIYRIKQHLLRQSQEKINHGV